jgi:hypothetical protein
VTDAADHFRKQVIVQLSAYNPGDDKTTRDDTREGEGPRRAAPGRARVPAAGGELQIPGVNMALRIGDRVSRIDGRDVSLRTNAGAEQGEAPTYPFVVAVTWTLGSHQSTTYQISDRRAEAQTCTTGTGCPRRGAADGTHPPLAHPRRRGRDRLGPFALPRRGRGGRRHHGGVSTTYPTVAGSFYAIHPAEVDGTPAEGVTATYVDDTASVLYAYNLGSGVPPQGTRVICHYSGGRWTFLFNT